MSESAYRAKTIRTSNPWSGRPYQAVLALDEGEVWCRVGAEYVRRDYELAEDLILEGNDWNLWDDTPARWRGEE